MFLNLLCKHILRLNRLKQWEKRNAHNSTRPIGDFDFERVSVGKYTYGNIDARILGKEGNLTVGHFCSIAGNVKFLVCAEHNIDSVSTFPFHVCCLKNKEAEAESRGDIRVCDDVWIGENAIILSGVTIGQGAVVAAGSVVNTNVPPYAVVGGVPGRILKYRFDDALIHMLCMIDYSRITKKMVREHIDFFNNPPKSSMHSLPGWLPKREI